MRKYTAITIIFNLFVFSVLLLGCGSKSDDDVVEDAILHANILLSSRKCDEAIECLELIGRRQKNAMYLKTLASAYACKAGFDEPTLFATDFPKLTTNIVWGSFTNFTSSAVIKKSNAIAMNSMFEAIDILLYAGGILKTTEPTSDERSNYFLASDALDINIQLMYMSMAAIGTFVRYYGNASAGVKGGGTYGNNCFINYKNAINLNTLGVTIEAFINANPFPAGNACNSKPDDDGHPDLEDSDGGDLNNNLSGDADIVQRLCKGVVFLNTFRQTLGEVISSFTGDDLANLSTVLSTGGNDGVNDRAGQMLLAKSGMGDVNTMLSYTNCVAEAVTDTASGSDNLQTYYLYMYEFLFK
ncbi:MAG: hypothetical protein KAQ98_06905 [Bacteriovoracaceae bacterium]|nr:hypothetical protein [Bacteriovoracaceae bacterium]